MDCRRREIPGDGTFTGPAGMRKPHLSSRGGIFDRGAAVVQDDYRRRIVTSLSRRRTRDEEFPTFCKNQLRKRVGYPKRI